MAFLDSILSAGVTGLVGNVISTIFTSINQKQKNKHELAIKELDIKAMIEEANANIKVTETQVQGDIALSEMEAFNESVRQNAIDQISDNVLGKLFDNKWTAPFGVLLAMLFGIVDFLKAFIRPGVTLYMTIATTWIYFHAYGIIQEDGFSYDNSMELFRQITDTILYVFVTVVLWWFGERRISKTINRTNNWK